MSRSSTQPPSPTPSPDLSDASMGRCEVTGQVVAADALVEFHGRRVCAEGKALLLEHLRTGAALPGQPLARPTNWRRLRAWMIDWALLMILATLIVVVAAGPMLYRLVEQMFRTGQALTIYDLLEHLRTHPLPLAVASVIIATIDFLYYIILHHWRGQTVGKKLLGLKVVRLDDSAPTLGQVVVRESFHTGLVLIYTVVALAMLLAGASVNAAVFGASAGEWAHRLFILVSGIVLWTDERLQRAIHDRLAGTRVVDLCPDDA